MEHYGQSCTSCFACILGAGHFPRFGTKDAAYILCVHVRTFTIFRGNVLPNGASYGLRIDNSADCKIKIPIIKQTAYYIGRYSDDKEIATS